VDSPRLASIGGQSKKLKTSTFGWGMVGCWGRYFWDLEGGILGALFSFPKDAWAKGLGGS